MAELKDLRTEVNSLVRLCEEANKSLYYIDAFTQHKYFEQIKKLSLNLFKDLDTRVSIIGKKDLIKDIQDRETLLRLYFILLKSLYMFSKMGVFKFEDLRCQGSTMLAYKIIQDLDFNNKFGQSKTWINNDTIYIEGILYGVKEIHPTNMQTLLRCITATLLYPDVKSQNVPEYMERFERYIIYYLMQCKPEERIYLDFV